ncbi:MAG: hypothetical protein EHM41_22275 [Chloroflexi bacterium]|nr:MAG: hypothetical protein EHM41_22275 [Chloroflexota bacterium]
MSNRMKWINRQVRLGWLFLASGLIVGVAGILLPWLVGDLPFNQRIITAVGILLCGCGVGYLMRYGAVRKDDQAARRSISEERGGRTQIIRARAGNRAYWVSAGLAYTGLMWLSFGQSGSLPLPTTDILWYFMAAVVILPFGVYAASLAYDLKYR